MTEEKYISIAIQDSVRITREALVRLPKPAPTPVDLVKRVEEEYTTGSYRTPSGKFAFFNESIKSEITSPPRQQTRLLRDLRVELLSDGYGYAMGGYIESDFFFTPQDRKRLPEGFPFTDFEPLTDSELLPDDLKFAIDYQGPPESWRRSTSGLERQMYEQGWLQMRVGINTDLEGKLPTEEQVTKEKRRIWLGLVEKEVEVRKQVPILESLPEQEDKASKVLLAHMIAICQALEHGVNSFYRHVRYIGKPLGEVHLAYVSNEPTPQVVFSFRKGDELLAKSYDVRDVKGTKLYYHHFGLDDGKFKVKQKEDEPKRGTSTQTIDRPRQETPTIEKPKPKPEVPKPKQGEERILFKDVVGSEYAKQELVRVCDYFRNPDEYRKWGISQKAGVLLYGPPGTGKTLLARALANEADAHFMLYKSQEMLSKWHGESEANLGKLLEDARGYERSIILIDEFDALGRKRGSDASGVEGRLVSVLLSFLDGFERHDNVYLVGTTNRKEDIDSAILERLYPIEVPLPGFDERQELVRQRIEKHRAIAKIDPFGKIDYNAIAKASEGLSGRILASDKYGIFPDLLHKAKEESDRQGSLYLITTQDWLDAIQKARPEPPKRPVGFH